MGGLRMGARRAGKQQQVEAKALGSREERPEVSRRDPPLTQLRADINTERQEGPAPGGPFPLLQSPLYKGF